MAPDTPESSIHSEVALFRGLTAEQLSKIGAHLRCRTFPTNTNVLTAEELGGTGHVVLKGSVKVYATQPDDTEVVLAALGRGELIGEMSLADSLGRSAHAVTLEETSFLLIDLRTFRVSVEEMPTMALNLANVLSRRLRLANTHQ